MLVHLAFIILGGREETREVNLTGSRNVFARRAHVKRLVYTSSVAAYGFHADNPQPLTEDVQPRGSERVLLLAEELEQAAAAEEESGRRDATCCARASSPARTRRALARCAAAPGRAPLLPDPGTPFQLVHHDDVATALVAATLGPARRGVYNLAGDGTITLGDLARALGVALLPGPADPARPRLARRATAARAAARASGSTPAACRW